MKIININENDSGQRLDKFLHKMFKETMPSSLIYKYIRKNRVKVNGRKSKIDYILQWGDTLQLYINDEFFDTGKKRLTDNTGFDFDIIYEDENLILIDKKPGVTVHDDNQHSKNTLIAQLHSYLSSKGEYDAEMENSFAPSLCNRLDKNTSGIIIAAKNAASLRAMNYILKQRMVKKYYLALCRGVFENKQATLTGYLRKDSNQNKVYVSSTPVKDAQKIITSYRVIKQNKDSALLEIELVTGRTHQIRAHLASINHPVAGDKKYGHLKGEARQYQALHSYKLEFLGGFEDTCLSYLAGKTFVSQSADFI